MSENDHHTPTTPLLGKIKTRGRSFIGSKTPKHHDRAQEEDEMPFLSPFLRSSVKLKSFRKRKMANREDNQVDGSLNKKLFLGKDEIELKIEENIKMRDGIMKLINGCHDAKQAVDISKNLLTINSRVLSLMSSLQKKRSTSILKDYNQKQSKDGQALNVNEACLGQVCISDIRIPLLWKADSHFKTKPGEPATLLYHMFCLLKIADQVYDTPLIQFNQIDTDVTFEDLYVFHDVPADFKLEVEVYYTVMHNPDNPVWTPMRSQRKTVYESAPKYCLAAHSQLTIDGIKEGFVTSDFVMGSQGASVTAVLGQVDDLPENPLALWGQFSCYLRAKPACMLKDVAEGSMYFQTSNGGQPSWEKYFCRLRHCTIQGWKHYPQKGEPFQIEPNLSIKIKENMEVRVEKSYSEDKNVLILTSSVTEKEPVISFDSACDFDKWRKALNQNQFWRFISDHQMTMTNIHRVCTASLLNTRIFDVSNIPDIVPKSPRSAKKSLRVLSKPAELGSKRSFYDLIDISEETVTQTNKENGDLNVVNNGTTPSFKDDAMDVKGEAMLQHDAMEEDTCKTTDQNGEETSNAVTGVEMSSRPPESVGQLVNDSVVIKDNDIAVVQQLDEAEHKDESLPSTHVVEDVVERHEDVEIVEEDYTATTATAGALEEVKDNTEDAAALSLESNEDEDVDTSMEEDVGEKIFEELNSLVSSELESTPQHDVSSSFDIEASSGQRRADSLVKDVSLLKESRDDFHGEDDGAPNEAVECLKDSLLSEDEEGDKSLEGLNSPEVVDNESENCTNDDSKVSEGREESEERADTSNVENCDESHIQEDDLSHIEDDQSNLEDDQSNIEVDQSHIEDDQSNIEDDQSHIEDDQSNIEDDQSHIEDDQSNIEADQSNIEADQSHIEDDQSNLEDDQSNIEVDESHIEDDQSNIDVDQSHIEVDESHIEDDQSNIEVDLSNIEAIKANEYVQSENNDDSFSINDSELVKTPSDNSISTTEQFDNPERNGDEELNLKTNDHDGQSKTVSDTHEKTIKIQTDV
eukprot:gene5156-5806_t